MPAMDVWARRRDRFLDYWHLPTLERPKGPQRGVVAACGENLGESELEWNRDESVIGNRCASCQGMALSTAQSTEEIR